MALNEYITHRVLVLTVDGRTLVGSLLTCDQQTNLVLGDAEERIIRSANDPTPSTLEPVGMYMIRGDQVVCVGRVNEEIDKSIDWSKVRGKAIGSTKRS